MFLRDSHGLFVLLHRKEVVYGKEMINRLKIVLAEEQKVVSGWQRNWEKPGYSLQMGDKHHAARRKEPPTYSRGLEY